MLNFICNNILTYSNVLFVSIDARIPAGETPRTTRERKGERFSAQGIA
jgi:hypothetical protein